MRGYLKKQKTAFGNIAGSGLEVVQKGREINTVARAFNSGYGTAEGLRQAFDCLKDIAQAAYEVRKEGFTHAP